LHVKSRLTRIPCAASVVMAVVLCAANAHALPFDCLIDPSLTLKLGSPITSILDRVDVDRGDHVKPGQVVATLESAVERAAVTLNEARAKNTAEIEAKQAVLELKRGILARKRSLQASSYASAQDIETAQAEFHVAEQDLAAARSNRHIAEIELDRARATLEQRTIRSPVDGVVVKRVLGPGEYVHQESQIITLARIDPLNVETFLPVRYYRQIKVGDTATVWPNEPIGGERQAVIKIVDQVFDAASGTFGVRLELANPEFDIPAGLRCRVGFNITEQPADGRALEIGQAQ
jgi:RND family efflux transporter MFP subunit